MAEVKIETEDQKRLKQLRIASMISGGASMASEFIDPTRDDGSMNVNKTAGKTALQMGGQGAAIGMAFGPIGGAIGAGVGALAGGLLGKSQAKKENDAIDLAKKKKINLNMSFANDQQEADFNGQTPLYMSKGGKVPKNGETIDADPQLHLRLRAYQARLTKAYNDKFGDKINVKDTLTKFATKKDFDRRNLDKYANDIISSSNDYALTADDIKAVLGKDYDNYIKDQSEYQKSDWSKNYNTLKGSKEQDASVKDIRFGARQLLERYRFGTNDVPYTFLQDKGGFIDGKGTESSDSNEKKVEPGSFVVPSIKGKPKEVKDVVKKIASSAGVDKTMKGNDNADGRKVNLSDGELVIPKDKIQLAQLAAQEQGTSLDTIANNINAMKTAKPTKKDGYYEGKFVIPETLSPDQLEEERRMKLYGIDSGIKFKKRLKINRLGQLDFNNDGKIDLTKQKTYNDKALSESNSTIGEKQSFNPLDEKGDYTSDRVLGGLQAVAGVVGGIRDEAKIRKGFRQQENIVNQAKAEEGAANFATASSKKAAINVGNRDIKNSIDQLRQSSMKDLAKNSMSTQEFGQNYADTASTLADKVSQANNSKTSALLNVDADTLKQTGDIIRSNATARLGIAESENNLNSAKMSQSLLTQKAGIENLMVSIKNEKSDIKRKRMMQNLIAMRKAQGKSLDNESAVTIDDFIKLANN